MNLTITNDQSAGMLLELHHQRLDDMLDDIELCADAENWSEAKRRFAGFRRDIEEHIRLEEELIFPIFEANAAMPHGPTVVMRAEHVAIRQTLAAVEAALADERPISRTTAELEAQLAAHNFKEERVLYPAFERLAAAATRAALAATVEALLRGRDE